MSTLKHFHDQANGPQSFPLALQYHGDGQVSKLVIEDGVVVVSLALASI